MNRGVGRFTGSALLRRVNMHCYYGPRPCERLGKLGRSKQRPYQQRQNRPPEKQAAATQSTANAKSRRDALRVRRWQTLRTSRRYERQRQRRPAEAGRYKSKRKSTGRIACATKAEAKLTAPCYCGPRQRERLGKLGRSPSNRHCRFSG